jgi:hypothetical protein
MIPAPVLSLAAEDPPDTRQQAGLVRSYVELVGSGDLPISEALLLKLVGFQRLMPVGSGFALRFILLDLLFSVETVVHWLAP